MPVLWSMSMFKHPAWQRGAVGQMEKRNCGTGMVAPCPLCANCMIAALLYRLRRLRHDIELAHHQGSHDSAVYLWLRRASGSTLLGSR